MALYNTASVAPPRLTVTDANGYAVPLRVVLADNLTDEQRCIPAVLYGWCAIRKQMVELDRGTVQL